MRPIVLADMDKVRPVLILTRGSILDRMTSVSVAMITSTIRGISTELPVGPANGLDHDSVVSLDNINTISARRLGRNVGYLFDHQEEDLATALRVAFDLQ